MKLKEKKIIEINYKIVISIICLISCFLVFPYSIKANNSEDATVYLPLYDGNTEVIFRNVDQDGNKFGDTKVFLNDATGGENQEVIFDFSTKGMHTVSLNNGIWIVDVESSDDSSCTPTLSSFFITVKDGKVYKEKDTTVAYSNNTVDIINTCSLDSDLEETEEETNVIFENVDQNGNKIAFSNVSLSNINDTSKITSFQFTSSGKATIPLSNGVWKIGVFSSSSSSCTPNPSSFYITVKDGKVYKGKDTTTVYSDNTVYTVHNCPTSSDEENDDNESSVEEPTLELKVIGEDGTLMQGIDFSLVYADTDSEIDTIEIGEDGLGSSISSLKLNRQYYVTQWKNSSATNVKDGYKFFDDKIELSVSSDGTILCTNCNSMSNVTFSNNRLEIVISKEILMVKEINISFETLTDKNETLNGAEFAIYEKNDSTELFSWNSSSSKISHSFEFGKTYVLKQTVVPEGFYGIKDTEFTITDDGIIQITSLAVEDTYYVACSKKNCSDGKIVIKNYIKVEVEDTASYRVRIISIIGFILSMVGLCITCYALHENKKQLG